MDSPARSEPTATYRLQLSAEFPFDEAAARVPYLAELGVSHLFCSPILQAAPGSMHGYDVVDHSRISEELGGEGGFRRLAAAAHEHGLGVVVDIVPNHMAVPTPLWHNPTLWDVLRSGDQSPFAHWFDVDLSAQRAVLMPVLGAKIGTELGQGTIGVETRPVPGPGGVVVEQPVVVYHDRVFPVRPGTEALELPDLLDNQWYRLAHWKVGSEELNYRRFFDVDTLAAIRVEDDDVFAASHRLLVALHAEGVIDGFRIDHPDGLANPRRYLADLQRATGGCWVVVEKILEPHEGLPGTFECAGTTGYDALLRVEGLFHDPAGIADLTDLWERVSGSGEGFRTVLGRAKHEVISESLFTEVNRLGTLVTEICAADIRLRDHTRRQIHRALVELLVAMDRYRAYLEPGLAADPAERQVIVEAADRARAELADDEQDTLDLVVALACGDPGTGEPDAGAGTLPGPGLSSGVDTPHAEESDAPGLRAEFMVRFAQTCGPVMAKSKEDTAFYRWARFIAVNEVGSDPTLVGVSPDEFHDFCRAVNERWPTTMTTLSTHDTKRSEDVRARLAAISEHAKAWVATVAELRAATAEARREELDGATELFLWQTLAATWRLPGTRAGAEPIAAERLCGYLTKAIREARTHTSWTAPNEGYEDAVLGFARSALASPGVGAALDAWTRATASSVRAAVLGAKLLQLTMPGVADLYQGCELVDLSLVDPDNRRLVDFDARAGLLERLRGSAPTTLDAEKLLVTSRALQLRRQHAEAFRGEGSEYRPVACTSGHAIAFSRGLPGADRVTCISVATRLPAVLAERGGFDEHRLILPEGPFRDLLSGRQLAGGDVAVADVLADLPVALLVPVQ